MIQLLQDPMFLYGIAFAIFFGLVFLYGRKPVLAWLDSEISKISAELEQARVLRAEAESALALCKQKHEQAEEEARHIIAHAQEQVKDMRQQAEADLANTLKRHEVLAEERIRLAQNEAVMEVRLAAIELAVSLAQKSLAENVSDADAAQLIEQAIGDISALKKSRAKAA